MPRSINVEPFAKALGVDDNLLRHGSYGSVECQEPISQHDINTSSPVTKLHIEGVEVTCLAVGRTLNEDHGKPDYLALAVCPVPIGNRNVNGNGNSVEA